MMGLGAFGGGLGVTRALVEAGAKHVLVTDLADETKLATSIRRNPARLRQSTSAIFSAVGMGRFSFCNPSRGATSTISTSRSAAVVMSLGFTTLTSSLTKGSPTCLLMSSCSP